MQSLNTGAYGKFEIDTVLGRVNCPPDLRLLYTKAAIHAFTSFTIPDPLTGMTGTEEAVQILRSGQCQPWTPIGNISSHAASVLSSIQNLSPGRQYYPKDKRRLQRVIWDNNLTATIQNDMYDIVVSEIIEKSNRLQAFTLPNQVTIENEPPSYLRIRGASRSIYERNAGMNNISTKDKIYRSRDQAATSPGAANAFRITKTLFEQQFTCGMTRDLSAILENSKFIGGFHQHSTNAATNISNSLDILTASEIIEQWGAVVNFFRRVGNSYPAVFRLALLSFSEKADMDLIESLAAFCCLPELKTLKAPIVPSFAYFRLHSPVRLQMLEKLIESAYAAFQSPPGQNKAAQKLALEKYHQSCLADGSKLARILHEQWPCMKPSPKKFSSTFLNVEKALKALLPEWQRLYHNLELSDFVDGAQRILNRHKGRRCKSLPQDFKGRLPFSVTKTLHVVPSFDDLVLKSKFSSCEKLPKYQLLPYQESWLPASRNDNDSIYFELGSILESFVESPNDLRQQYGNDLLQSLAILKDYDRQSSKHGILPGQDAIKKSIGAVNFMLANQFERIRTSLCADDPRFKWLAPSHLWPSFTPIKILEGLRTKSNHHFGDYVKENLVSYGVLITSLQRLLRIKDVFIKRSTHKLLEEWRNAGHENWQPLKFPDWLLLEIDGNILIRNEQIAVANAIISPMSGANSVLQMNMGKGKFFLADCEIQAQIPPPFRYLESVLYD